jgi:ATP-dependent Lhr-like helicase
VYEALCRRGALFAAQLAPLVSMPPAQVEDALGELVAAGLVTCDGFAALRGLIVGARRRHLRRHAAVRPPQSGRWCLLRGFGEAEIDRGERAERWCQLLLRRYGVMFRDLLAREAAAPPWYELCRAFRRLEARGDIRGGRFVAQVAGEQYALPTIISGLRRKEEADDGMLTLAATDPLNLGGRGRPGGTIPAAAGTRIGLRCALAGSERAT